uniref:Uncharacterized protein n=1 Tax=Ciona intestinalis TaxID=7719 RepID=H2XTZ4_CIOIN
MYIAPLLLTLQTYIIIFDKHLQLAFLSMTVLCSMFRFMGVDAIFKFLSVYMKLYTLYLFT